MGINHDIFSEVQESTGLALIGRLVFASIRVHVCALTSILVSPRGNDDSNAEVFEGKLF